MSKKDGGKNRKSARFESEQTMSAGDVAGYLEGLAKGLREGTIALGEQGESFRLAPAGDVEFEVQAKQGKKKSRIKLALAFRRAKDDDGARSDDDEDAEGKEAAETATTIPDEMSF